jgi:hypothetical protein
MKLGDLEIDVLTKALKDEAMGLWKYEQEGRKLTDAERATSSVLFYLAAALDHAVRIQADPQRRTFGEQVDQCLANLPE